MAQQYIVYNSALATTAAPIAQPTGTAIRTMLQLKLGVIPTQCRLKAWGCSFDGSAAATPGKVELFETSVAATMSTAYVAADIQSYNDSSANYIQTGNVPIDVTSTSTSGFATAAVTEGTVANYRCADLQLIAPTNQYVYQWPLGCEFMLTPAKFLRLRVTFGTTVNMYAWIVFET